MKYTATLVLLALIGAAITIAFHRQANDPVNAVLGDTSFMEQFGKAPTPGTDEDLRIRTHLAHVEGLLRQRPVAHLSPAERVARGRVLDLLHVYTTQGVFPRNQEHPGRRVPCFIDDHGRICAVGYLVEHTAGRHVAERINTDHQFDEILAMRDPVVNNWASAHGLSLDECAMIQPTYGWTPVVPTEEIPTELGVSSAVLGGVNVALNTINAVQMINGSGGVAVPAVGVFTGAGSMVLGVGDLMSMNRTGHASENRQILAYLNIGLGTTTMIMSVWGLIAKKTSQPRATTWDLRPISTADGGTAVGVGLVRRF